MTGQSSESITVVPISMTAEGISIMISWSLRESMPHMPRVILRTVEPAKALACQSVEKRCTRRNASSTIACIMLSVIGMICMKAVWRSSAAPKPSAIRRPKAVRAAFQATTSLAAPWVTASTSWPAKSGVSTSARVARRKQRPTTVTRMGCLRQWAKVKPRTSRNASPRRSSLEVAMKRSGCRWQVRSQQRG